MKEIKKFNNKKLNIRELKEEDIKNAKKFLDYINELAEDPEAYILIKEKQSLKQEKDFIREGLKKIKEKKSVRLVVEADNLIVSVVHIDLKRGAEKHVGELGIAILKEYRNIGLGTHLLKKIIELAKKELEPSPTIIRLSVASINKLARHLYEKIGFKEVAEIPDQLKYDGENYDEIVMLKYL